MTAKDLAIAHARHQQRLGKAGEPSKTSPIDRGTGLVQANRPADRKSGSQEFAQAGLTGWKALEGGR
ncbi:hypothetical protein, partial [Stutzerimonas kirkiae]|uniref:hypothetical protein n=1 Tax=Stutzerimonas kirkiae TaxID=2211392 RepID=UPI001A95515A